MNAGRLAARVAAACIVMWVAFGATERPQGPGSNDPPGLDLIQ